ncbi:MAG: YdcF family protein [Anaerolineae bacterium]|nr:YdcF family protein [Anaerolineae bacterium]
MIWLLLLIAIALIVLIPLLLRELVANRYTPRIYTDEADVSDGRVAIVFGAAVRNGYPSTMLRDRLDAAIQLFRDGRVDHLLMSGDGRESSYDEPEVMARYAVANGVPEAAITLDRLGLRTYDTCYRARDVYHARQVVLVTQEYHLPRALFTCELLGLDAVGFSADQRTYRNATWYDFRELLALPVAAWDVLMRPVPTGGLEP